MKTRLRRTFVLLLALLTLSQSAMAAFVRVNEPVEFSDVPDTHWAYRDIRSMYEYGLMLGTGGDLFSPSGTVSAAQAITVAVRMWDLYRDGDGILDQRGENWYDGAVGEALSLGLIREGQFDRYDRAATRAEIVGLLAGTLPPEEYKAINEITEIPDVNGSTPYAKEIFLFYNAGILAGSDDYGTFYPERDITRAELSAILYRMIADWNRKEFSLLPKPADLTVYSSSKCLFVEGIPLYGLTRIDGEYYVPVAVIEDEEHTPTAQFVRCYGDGEGVYVSFPSYANPKGTVLNYAAIPPEGKVMGTASPNPGALELSDGRMVNGAVYTIGGHYPMISLKGLGAVEQNGGFVLDIPERENSSAVYESDLAGAPVPQLVRGTDRETVIAIHDYLVNYLTYDITVDPPYGTTDAEIEAVNALIGKSYEEYTLSTNRAMSTKYAICEDYAELFQAMCIRLGIPCDIVTGTAGGAHAWNKVYVDGQWLYMDCTWDDPISKTPVLKHTYCLVGPDVMVKSHWWDGSDYPMPAEYDPAWEQLDPYNITSADMFRKCLIAQMVIANRNAGDSDEERVVKLRVTNSGAYGGTGCIYANYEGAYWWSMYGGYDSASGMYVYKFM